MVFETFFRPFGITVSAAVIISLLVARTLSPLLAAHWLRAAPKQVFKSDGFTVLPILSLVTELGAKALGDRVSAALINFIAGIALNSLIPKGFIPRVDHGEFTITYTTPLAASNQGSNVVSTEAKTTHLPSPPVLSVDPLAASLQV